MRTDMDDLAIGPFFLDKADQPALELAAAPQAFGLD
jgi:hypothetical protein